MHGLDHYLWGRAAVGIVCTRVKRKYKLLSNTVLFITHTHYKFPHTIILSKAIFYYFCIAFLKPWVTRPSHEPFSHHKLLTYQIIIYDFHHVKYNKQDCLNTIVSYKNNEAVLFVQQSTMNILNAS